jgi:hypothetical protein
MPTITYCDLCSGVIKESEYYMLSIASINDRNHTTMEEYNTCLDKLLKEIKYICPTCKKLIDEIFRLRLQNINQISLELLGIYELPSKDDEKKRK